jgi:ubiquitin-conjugating enzyme E2 O
LHLWTELKLVKDFTYRPQTNTRFYPGAHLLTRDSSDIFLHNPQAQWLNGQWESDRHQGKVTKVEMAGVLVCWIASAEYGVDQRLFHEFAPPAYQNPHNLTYFCSDRDCTWGLGDRCFLLSAEEENHDHAEQQHTSSKSPAPPLTMTVGNTDTTVDVLWQDGTRQHGARSTVINPTSSINGLHFFPGQYVVDNSPTDDVPVDGAGDVIMSAAGGSTRRIGVVRSQNFKDQTVNVSWFKAAAATLPDSCKVECDDIVSAYELIRDPDHSVFFGDVVVRKLSNASESTQGGQQLQAKSALTDLSWVGRVVDLHDGHVQVKWGDDNTSTVCFHILFLTYIYSE